LERIPNPPDAKSLMLSARSFGNYDLPSALADLIDNSIKAKAKTIHITCLLNEGEPEVRLRDDGEGMSPAELFVAMRPASTSPEQERSPDDLGRFGWGMKSASFSQCRHLTVVSSNGAELSGAAWDLDDIDHWNMTVLSADEAAQICHTDVASGAGTEIIWSTCDRLSEKGRIKDEAFNELVTHARQRLALLFHRFLNGENGLTRLRMYLNGQPIAPFDPFHRENNATQPLHPETMGDLVKLLKGTEPWSSHFGLVEEHLTGKGWLDAARK
jgi:hypothetical protein